MLSFAAETLLAKFEGLLANRRAKNKSRASAGLTTVPKPFGLGIEASVGLGQHFSKDNTMKVIEFTLTHSELKYPPLRRTVMQVFNVPEYLANPDRREIGQLADLKLRVTAEAFGIWIVRRNEVIQEEGVGSNNIRSLNAKVLDVRDHSGSLFYDATRG